MKQSWAYQQYDTVCNTKILLTLINQANRKSKQQWCNWVGEVCSVNWSDQLYRLSLYLLMQSILSIVSIVSIVLTLAFSISVRCNWRIIQMNQQTLGWPFGVKGGNFSRLLESTFNCKYFTRSVWEINKTPLGVMTSNYPRGKSFPFETVVVVIFSPGKKGINIVIYHLGCMYQLW